MALKRISLLRPHGPLRIAPASLTSADVPVVQKNGRERDRVTYDDAGTRVAREPARDSIAEIRRLRG